MSMLYQDQSNFGKQIPIYVRAKVLEDSTKLVDTAETFYAALPVTIDTTSGKLIPVAGNVKAYGLAKFQKNQYLDEVSGTNPSGIYGSGRGTVVVKGIVDVLVAMPFVLADGSTVSVPIVDVAGGGLVPMAPLYVNSTTGTITANDATWANSLFGYVLNYDAAAGILQILLP